LQADFANRLREERNFEYHPAMRHFIFRGDDHDCGGESRAGVRILFFKEAMDVFKSLRIIPRSNAVEGRVIDPMEDTRK
jgi:hypothetical protein